MKRTPSFEKRQQRRHAARISIRPTRSRSVHNNQWLVTPDVDEGPDAAIREVIERIARGDRIRGHAL